MRADMGGNSWTQAVMRERVTHRHVPVYVLPKDIMWTATATLTTCPATPAICYGRFFRAIPIYSALYRQGHNSPTEIERTSPRRGNAFFHNAKRSRDSCEISMQSDSVSKFAIKIFYHEYSSPISSYSNFINQFCRFFYSFLFYKCIYNISN